MDHQPQIVSPRTRPRPRICRGLLLVPVLLSLFPTPAMACTLCGWAIMWCAFPPIIAWSMIIGGWYVAQSITDHIFGVRHRFTIVLWILIPATPIAIHLFPPVIAAMLIPPLLTLVRMIPPWQRKTPWGHTCASVCLAGVCMVLFYSTYVTEIRKARNMTQVEIIVKWSGTAVGRDRFMRLQQREPESAVEYREMLNLRHYNYLYGWAAEALARCGEPTKDLPLLLESLAAVDENLARQWHGGLNEKYIRRHLEQALGKMLGEDLPENTPTSVWREKVDAFLAQGGAVASASVESGTE